MKFINTFAILLLGVLLSAQSSHEAQIYQGGLPNTFVIDNILDLLVTGENTLAIQTHNYEISSSDMTMIPFFTLGLNAEPANSAGPAAILETILPNLHTNFKISSNGETILLSDDDDDSLDEVTLGPLAADISIGRQPDGTGEWFMFLEPTPGASNSTTAYQEFAGVPDFSLNGGFYTDSLILELETTSSNQMIYYTLDGSAPGDSSEIYSEPIVVDSTMVVRARNVGAGLIPGKTVTNTFFINESYTLPVVSICSDPANFFDEEIGIFTMGDSAETVFPFYGANFWQDWEKPINFELFELDGTTAMNYGAGVKIFGNFSRGHAQKSLAIFARNQYDTAPFEYQIFEEKQIVEFEAFILRNSGNDWNLSMFRDALMTGIVADTGLDYQAYRPSIVFINGEYWGILNLREKVNEHFLAYNNNVIADDLNILEDNASIVQGNSFYYLQMRDFIANNDMSIQSNYDFISSQIDIDNFITYNAVEIFYGNTDWPSRNIKYWRDPTANGKWRWILYDTDFSMGLAHSANYNTLEFALEPNGPSYPNPPWATLILRKLVANDEFKVKFINTFADLINTNFDPDNIINRINEIHDILEPEIPNHFERWESDLFLWENEISIMREFAEGRPAAMTEHIMQEFDLLETAEVFLDIYPPETGKVLINSITVEEFPWEGTYFQNNPITLTGLDVPGYNFAGWSGDVISDSTTITIDMTGTTSLIAWFEEAEELENLIIFNEINYKAAEDFDCKDWVEIYNRSSLTIDISEWYFKDSNDDHIFNFPLNTIMQPGQYMVLSRNSYAFSSLYPEVMNIVGDFDFGLSSSGEKIRLFDSEGNVIDSVIFGVSTPWPTEPNGNGYTLSLLDPESNNDLAENWAASTLHGTPGTANTFLNPMEDPDKLHLTNNYPNPFSTFTTFEYWLPKDGKVKVEIFNVKGQLVRRLSNEFQFEGNHIAVWDGRNKYGKLVASGIYLYSVNLGRNQKTRKLIYLK
jgi:CotH kinase protein/Lamin Tail Domain/Chitobiase/beta-hexosaminidase C-terminal domain/FlgD Ig-like domain/Divergent InlB B-repeat domain